MRLVGVGDSASELRISARRLHNAGIVGGLVLLPFLLLAATLGRGFADPSLHGPLALVTIVAFVGSVGLEVNVRTAHITVAAGRVRWRLWGGWGEREKSIASIDRVELSPKGDVEIHFIDGDQQLQLSAKEFRRDDLRELARILSVAPGGAPS